MNVKAKKPFVARNSSTGELTSVACGEIISVSSEYGATLISDGLAEAYTLITPTGTVNITINGGSHDVSRYAYANVNVRVVKTTYDANGGTGTIDPEYTAAGDPVALNDGTTLTAPEGKTFAGWGLAPSATEPDVPSPYIATASATIYAVWVDA